MIDGPIQGLESDKTGMCSEGITDSQHALNQYCRIPLSRQQHIGSNHTPLVA
jgi:hypothetical protein